MGFSFLIIKSGSTTADASKVNETKVVQSEIKSIESTSASQIHTTTVQSSTNESNVTKAFEVTTSTYLASTTVESPITYEDDYYDEETTIASNTTEVNEIEDVPIISTTIPTIIHTHVLESTTEVTVTTTTIASTTETSTTSDKNVTTTTVAPNPKNETKPESNTTESNGILKAQIVTDLYTYYTMIAPIVLRIIFGIVVSMTKVKDALKKPTGIGISLFCYFFYMPLVSLLV